MDTPLGLALRGGVAPYQEHLLQGSIVDTSREVLIHRLRGLCDNAESPPETFNDHELVFAMSSATQQAMFFRVRHSLTHQDMWHLRYVGQAEGVGDKNRHCLVRTRLDVGTSDNVVQFLNEMGFRLDHEFVVKGFFFHKGRMKITVSKIFRMLQPGNTNDNLEAMLLSSLVELSVVAPAGQDQIGEEMKNFAEQLKPLVQLEKVDHRRLLAM